MEKEANILDYKEGEFCAPGLNCASCAKAGICDWNGTNKLTVFDIFARIPQPGTGSVFPFVEVRFKNTRKDFYYGGERQWHVGQAVAVESVTGGYDVGIISAVGETARLQMRERGVEPDKENLKKIYRPATQRDLDIWKKYREKEEWTKLRSREIAKSLGLVMKISDTEYQADGGKVTIYYTAEDRVDFRELIKILAKEFSTRIEMRQIGYRQEAARLGGLGSCGRELCCSAWLTDFRSVSTQSAKYQQLAINTSKLTGQCGKLKCCLNFELDSYKDALKEFPDENLILQTEKGDAKSMKIDVFKGHIWYAYVEGDNQLWYKLNLDQVNEIMELNKQNQKAPSLESYADDLKLEKSLDQIITSDSLLSDNINRFDDKKKKRKKKKNKSKKNKQNASVRAGKKQGNDRNQNRKKSNKKRRS